MTSFVDRRGGEPDVWIVRATELEGRVVDEGSVLRVLDRADQVCAFGAELYRGGGYSIGNDGNNRQEFVPAVQCGLRIQVASSRSYA